MMSCVLACVLAALSIICCFTINIFNKSVVFYVKIIWVSEDPFHAKTFAKYCMHLRVKFALLESINNLPPLIEMTL